MFCFANQGPTSSSSQMPTAAAVAAAAATAKIQAMDAVATNAVLGLSSKIGPLATPVLPVAPVTSVTSTTVPAVLPPPGIAIPQVPGM